MNVAIGLPSHIVGWIDRQLSDEQAWSSYLRVPDRPNQASFSREKTENVQMAAASQVDSSNETACKIPTLAHLASKVVIAHSDHYLKESLLGDMQSTLLLHTKNPSDYRQLMGSGLIESEVLKDFHRLKLEEKKIEISPSKSNDELDETQLEKANLKRVKNEQRAFLGTFFQNHLRSLSVDEKRQWIFRSRHPQAAPLVFLIFRVNQAVKEAGIKVLRTLGNKISSLPIRARRVLAALVVLSVTYALYCVGFYFQKALWSPFIPFFIRKVAAYQTNATIQTISQLAVGIFNHQYWLGVMIFLANNSQSAFSTVVKRWINRISKFSFYIVLVPSTIFIPPFIAGLALTIFVIQPFLLSSSYRSFSGQVKLKARQWIWPLLEPSKDFLSKSEKGYIRRVSAKWNASFQLPKALPAPSVKPVEPSKEKLGALPKSCDQPAAAAPAPSTVFPQLAVKPISI